MLGFDTQVDYTRLIKLVLASFIWSRVNLIHVLAQEGSQWISNGQHLPNSFICMIFWYCHLISCFVNLSFGPSILGSVFYSESKHLIPWGNVGEEVEGELQIQGGILLNSIEKIPTY